MFKLINILFFFCISSVFFAQKASGHSPMDQYLVYNLKYLPDSTAIDSFSEENFVLQIDREKNTCFVSENYLKAISSFNSGLLKTYGLNSIGNLPRTKFFFVIYQNQNHINYYDNVFFNKINYEEDIKLIWDITTEKKLIGDYSCSKATTKYGGRVWEAWFTNDIPLVAGPYKFSGLPGLIIEISDVKKNYQFSLLGVYSNKDPNGLFTLSSNKNYAKISKREYFVIRKNALENFGNQSQISVSIEDRRTIQSQVAKRNNNAIELR